MPGTDGDRTPVDRLFARLPSSYAAVARALRATIRAEAPGLRETVKWNNPFWTGAEDVLCLQCFSDHANLAFLQGARLAKGRPEIEGTGKSMRHVKIRSVAAARSRTVRRLIRAAVALDSAPAASPPKARAVSPSRGRRGPSASRP